METKAQSLSSDEELMEASREALPPFEELILRYQDSLRRYCLCLCVSPELAEEISTMCFLDLFRLRKNTWLKDPSAFLYRQATQAAYKSLTQSQARQKQVQKKAPFFALRSLKSERHFELSHRHERLRLGLLALEAQQRAMLALTLLEGLPFFKAALILEIPEEQLRRELPGIYQAFRQSLGAHFF